MERIAISLFILLATVCVTVAPANVNAGDLGKAKLLNRHGLTREAKIELIDVIAGRSNTKQKAEAYYMLGGLAFEGNDIVVALQTWRELSSRFPKSPQARMVKERIDKLAELVGDSATEITSNTVAMHYLRNGDFWSKGRARVFSIDSSWISSVDAAVKWYDLVIKEFPKSNASRIAIRTKCAPCLAGKTQGGMAVRMG